MSEPRLLTADELADASPQELRAHIAALKANNAALLSGLKDLVADMHTLMAVLVSRGISIEFTPHPDLSRLLESPHPGASLLEEHRKALVRARNEGMKRAAAYADLKADAALQVAIGTMAIPGAFANAEAMEHSARQVAAGIRDMMEPES